MLELLEASEVPWSTKIPKSKFELLFLGLKWILIWLIGNRFHILQNLHVQHLLRIFCVFRLQPAKVNLKTSPA